MKNCLREKCRKEFEPNKPKQVFCSDKCRVYNSRETKSLKPNPHQPFKKPIKNKVEKDSNSTTSVGLNSFQIYQRKKLGLK